MNTQVHKIKDEIERRIRETDLKDVDEYRSLLTFINSLPEEPINDNLEKEVKEYLQTNFPDGLGFPSVPKVAHHFAKWQKKQMMKDAIEGYITANINNELKITSEPIPDNHPAGVKFGDFVKVIIIKEETK